MMLAAATGLELGDYYAVGLMFGGLVLLVAVIALSQQHERAFTAAVVYLAFGALASLGLQLLDVDLIDPLQDTDLIERASEFAVIVALFSAGLRLDRKLSWGRWRSTVCLIGIVMPLTIGAVALFAGTAMGLGLGAAIILGAVLAPTDPVLAEDVQVGPPGETDEDEPRFALTSEAGLNDGLAFPFVFLGVFIAGTGGTGWIGEWLLADVLYAIAGGVAIGALAGRGLGALVQYSHRREWLLSDFDGWIAIAGVLAIYGLTEVAGAYGFLAAFAGGLAFRRHEHHAEHHGRVHTGAEMVEKVSELAVVLLLGSTVTLAGLAEPGLAGWLLVPLLLFVVRPAAAMLAFVRSPLPQRERLFIAWFGIRGIGSFYYAAVAINAGVLSAADAETIYWTTIVVAGASILLHGLTSTPAAKRLEVG